MKPASALCPKCVAKATVLRSTPTNIAPRNKYIGTSTTRPGAARRLRRPARRIRPGEEPGEDPDEDSDDAEVPATTGGSVDRCDANHSDPSSAHKAAVPTPAAGCNWVASTVTAAGPSTKHTSSATDSSENAVCSRGDPASRTDQRARAIGPVCGMVAPPVIPHRNSVQSGACSVTAADRPATARAKVMHTGISTRCWPIRSVSRPNCGAHIAPPIDPAADTLPASP